MQRIIYFLMAIAISFTTTVGYAKTVKFAILADVHVTPGNLNDEKIKDVVAEINSSDADVVGDLTERGVDIAAVKRQVIDLSSENRLRLLGFMLKDKLKVFPEKGAAYMAVSKKELRRFDFKKGDLEGVVNYALRIEGVRFAALLSERGDIIRMSFRSLSPKVDVNKFAARYWEGGGHVQAAGGTSSLGLELTCKILEQQIEKRLYDK